MEMRKLAIPPVMVVKEEGTLHDELAVLLFLDNNRNFMYIIYVHIYMYTVYIYTHMYVYIYIIIYIIIYINNIYI